MRSSGWGMTLANRHYVNSPPARCSTFSLWLAGSGGTGNCCRSERWCRSDVYSDYLCVTISYAATSQIELQTGWRWVVVPVQAAEREYIHSQAGKCSCDCAASVITLLWAVSGPLCIASPHTDGVKGKCQAIASHLSALGAFLADSDHLLRHVNV